MKKRALVAEDLFRIAVVSDPQVSPDGAAIAWVQTQPDKEADLYRSAIWISDRDGGNRRQLTSGQHRDTNPRWAHDSRTIAFVSNRPHVLPEPKASDAEDTKKDKQDNGKPAKPSNQVWTIRIDGGEAVQRTNHPNGAASPAWAPEGGAIAFIASDDVTNDAGYTAPSSVGPIADERVIRAMSYRFDGKGFLEKYPHLWTVELDTGEARQITRGDATDADPAWSPAGDVIAFTSNRSADRATAWNRSALYVVPVTGSEPLAVTPEDAKFSNPSWSPNGSRIAFLGHLGTDPGQNQQVWTTRPDGSDCRCETDGIDMHFGDAGMSDLAGSGDSSPRWLDSATIATLATSKGETQVWRAPVGKGKAGAITSGQHRIAGFAPLGDDLVVVRGTIARPFELERWSGDGALSSLSQANEALLAEVALADARELSVTAPDGKSIQAWLLPPYGFDERAQAKHPLIVQIHGGPHSMYGYAMFHEMQLMAAKGYAVVFSNPRGSSGYGQEFTTCTRGIWGEADMPDVMAVVDEAIKLPWIDADRLGVTGGSYGGYLTNWIIGHDDRFKAAVTQRCVSNFHSFFGTSDIGNTFGVHEFDGLPWSDAEKLLRHSPISYVEQMTTPLLIVHSEHDFRCPIEQAEQLFTSLRYLGREVAFVRIPEEGHELSRSGTPSRRLARLHHIIGWFDQHL